MRPFLEWMAIGDAFGMRYEFIEHSTTLEHAGLSYAGHPKFDEYQPGHYTDDTQLSAAHVELLLRVPTALINEDDLINAWLTAFKRDPRPGYSRRMREALLEADDVSAFRRRVDAARGTTGGAAMRAAPFGLLRSADEVTRLTTLQARITHDTPAGVTSALAIAHAVHHLHHGGSRDELEPTLRVKLGRDFELLHDAQASDPRNALHMVALALEAVRAARSMTDVLLNVVNGATLSDTDTVAAMAMAVASRCTELADDLPDTLRDGLENGRFGRRYLQALDELALRDL